MRARARKIEPPRDPRLRDAKLLLLIGLGFAALSGAARAVSIYALHEALYADAPLGGIAVTCAVAAAAMWCWAAVKAIQSYFVARLSRRRVVLHMLLVVAGVGASDRVLMSMAETDFVKLVESERTVGNYYLAAPEHAWRIWDITNCQAGGAWMSMEPVCVEPDDELVTEERSCRSVGSWYDVRAERAALRRSAEAAARCGWTSEALRPELDALAAAEAQFSGQPPATKTEWTAAVRRFPFLALGWLDEGRAFLNRVVADGKAKAYHQVLYLEIASTRFRSEPERLWILTDGGRDPDMILVDLKREVVIRASPAGLSASDGLPGKPAFWVSPVNCLLALALAWLVLLGPFCYLRRKAK